MHPTGPPTGGPLTRRRDKPCSQTRSPPAAARSSPARPSSPPAPPLAATAAPAKADEGKDAPEAAETQELTTTAWGATYPWAPEPPAIDPADIEEELDVDVAVVGLGVAGVAAFRAASEQGVKVAAVEKAAEPSVRSSQYCYINGTRTEALGLAEVDEDEIIKAEWNESCQFANYAIIRNFVRNESDVIDWWIDGDPECHIPEPGEQGGRFGDPNAPHTVNGGFNLTLDYANESQASYPTRISFGNHAGTVNANFERSQEAGGTAYFGHFAEQLIMDEGRCVGVYARNAETGKYKKVNAAMGVIMACGGCGNNAAMVKALYPVAAENNNLPTWTSFDVEGNPTNTGDGYPMGYWAGAGFSQNMCAMTHVMGGPNDVANMETSSGCTSQHLRLNYNGQRFMNEGTNVSDCELVFDRQPKKKAFLVFDAHYGEQIENCVTEFSYTMEDWDAKVDNETVFKADTLEELFAAIKAYDEDFEADDALASVERYNELCAAGYDEDFGKQEKYLFLVVDGPFYAQRMGIGLMLTTMGGLCSDEHAHVLTPDYQVIPGLYACGNIQGDRFAVKYPFKLSGASHAMAVYYGNVAGNTAASNDAANYRAKVYQAASAEDAGVSVEAGSLTDGTYEASGKGIGGDVPLKVTVENGTVTAVEVGENSETQDIGSKAVEQLPDAIVAAGGTAGVDAVSGATVTSKAIFAAVEDCLAQAGA